MTAIESIRIVVFLFLKIVFFKTTSSSLPLFIGIAFIPKVNDSEKSDAKNYEHNGV
jgi:hypothetical protein